MCGLTRVPGWAGLLALLLPCVPAFAEGTAAPHGSLYYLLQALGSLVVVIALIYAVYFGLRRLSHTGLPRKGQGLQVLESQHLGGGRWIYVIEVAGRVLVVGGGSEGLRTLAELPQDEYEGQSRSNEEEPSCAGD